MKKIVRVAKNIGLLYNYYDDDVRVKEQKLC